MNPRRAWLYYCYERGKLLDKWLASGYIKPTWPEDGFYVFKPKHNRKLRQLFWKALKKEWRGELINKHNMLLKHFDYK